MNPRARIVSAMKTPDDPGIGSGHMVAVVGERFAGGDPGNLANDLIALDHLAFAVVLLQHPLAPMQLHRAF